MEEKLSVEKKPLDENVEIQWKLSNMYLRGALA